jgi:succinate-semialdehyde dehydrogenase/glutarate-semialdehyde dehydrogenase
LKSGALVSSERFLGAVHMAYQTINPYIEELVKSFKEHTDTQLEAIIAQSEETYEIDWSRRSLAERKAILKKAASIR